MHIHSDRSQFPHVGACSFTYHLHIVNLHLSIAENKLIPVSFQS